jgi:hypothetical protein
MDFKYIVDNITQLQYNNTNLQELMRQKALVYNKYIGNLLKAFNDEILNLDTCRSSALDYIWGKYFKISRTFADDEGNLFSLSDAEFRYILKIKAFCSIWDGAINSLNNFLGILYRDRGIVFILDNQNMTVNTYYFKMLMSEQEKYIFTHYDILPRPAGIGTELINITVSFFALLDRNYQQILPNQAGFMDRGIEQEGQFFARDNNLFE